MTLEQWLSVMLAVMGPGLVMLGFCGLLEWICGGGRGRRMLNREGAKDAKGVWGAKSFIKRA